MIDKPIIVVGTGRSGSTIFFEALSQHESLGWLTNYDAMFPESRLAQLSHFLRRWKFTDRLLVTQKSQNKPESTFLDKILIRPAEAYAKWNQLCNREFGRDYLKDQTADDETAQRINDFFDILLKRQNKKRLVLKTTGPTRMTYLSSIFPNALFIHVIRDPCAVTSSLLRSKFWKDSLHQPRWKNGLPAKWQEEWKSYDNSPAALVAIQYRTILDICRQEQERLSTNQYIELSYSDFVEQPVQTMNKALQAVELPDSPGIQRFVEQPNRYRNMNFKYREHLSKQEVEMINHIVSDCSAIH